MPSNNFTITRFTAASNYSATTDIRVGSSITVSDPYIGESVARVQLRVGTACFLSLITKDSGSTVIGSAMLLPKTASAALTVNTLYVFHHGMTNGRLYNYQLSAAITGVDLHVAELSQPGVTFE